MKLDLKILAILVLIGVVVFQQCGSDNDKPGKTINIDGKKYEIIKHEIDTVEVEKVQTIYKKGKDIYHESIRTIEIPAGPIDTLVILKDFYAKNIYKDTIRLDDSLGTIVLIDTISQNKIQGRYFHSAIKQKTIFDKLIVKDLPKNQVFYGPMIGFNQVNIIGTVGGGLILKTKKDKVYQLSAGVGGPTLTPFVEGGIFWKIKIKK